jgi:hypothetical protein
LLLESKYFLLAPVNIPESIIYSLSLSVDSYSEEGHTWQAGYQLGRPLGMKRANTHTFPQREDIERLKE